MIHICNPTEERCRMDLIFPEEAHTVTVRHFSVPEPPGAPELRQQSNFPITSNPQISPAPDPVVVAAIQRRIECGSGLSSCGESGDSMDNASDPARRLAHLQSALSILCHTAAMDKSQFFLYRKQVSKKSTNDNAECASTTDYSITDIYTTVRALKLEYDEAVKHSRDEKGTQTANAEVLELARRRTECRVDDCLRLLEPTITELILDFTHVKKVPVAYTEEMLQGLPQVFAMERWPCTILRKETDDFVGQKRPRVSSRPLAGESGRGESFFEHNDVAHAATAVVFKALRDLRKNDYMCLLGDKTLTSAPKAADVSRSHLTYGELVERTLSGVYRERGLLAALYDVKRLLYGAYDAAPAEHAPTIKSLHAQFEQDLRRHYSAFLSKTGLRCRANDFVLQVKTMFDINPLPASREVKDGEGGVPLYSETQKKCLKLLGHLRAVDSKGWFEYPAFDLANIELSSIERWICGPPFSTKTDREAFVALRDVLEQMVDNCVLSYGPTSQYSRVITMVRQRLVEASQEVGLL
ncbi:hypothetical protein, conserved [Trypanosoma brucei brucei TREU927]|uniref:Uncharacterized protein n=1 Tax=Trypanosoma brucei brucei (strain 927/4 GUTat10.1) TaxID=185431 RepID=Q584F3_TRYB2|nr:hypothetical protein, conserved [Trypanosoma brucei brucei TREU927]AAX79052.1 hypothetical protein, conserved [Trypanosoma brucei]AAZ10825.1 hypothetical protein, conserved [Trypanosoma brucei brucei TREU927]